MEFRQTVRLHKAKIIPGPDLKLIPIYGRYVLYFYEPWYTAVYGPISVSYASKYKSRDGTVYVLESVYDSETKCYELAEEYYNKHWVLFEQSYLHEVKIKSDEPKRFKS